MAKADKTDDTAGIAVGDKVQYVPDVIHAFDQDPSGNYAWEFGEKDKQGRVTLLSKAEVDRVRGLAVSRQAKMGMTPLRPAGTWSAVVRKVNADGTVDLDIAHFYGGVTLHYDRIAVDDTGKPNTCKKA